MNINKNKKRDRPREAEKGVVGGSCVGRKRKEFIFPTESRIPLLFRPTQTMGPYPKLSRSIRNKINSNIISYKCRAIVWDVLSARYESIKCDSLIIPDEDPCI